MTSTAAEPSAASPTGSEHGRRWSTRVSQVWEAARGAWRRAWTPDLLTLVQVAPADELTTVTQHDPVHVGQLGEASLRGQRVLEGADRNYLAGLVSEALHTFATSVAATDDTVKVKAGLAFENSVGFIAGFVARREGEIARRKYAVGLGWGVAASVVVLVAVGVVAPLVMQSWLTSSDIGDYNRLALRDTLVVIGGGAAGAAVSVLLRLHRAPDLKIETVRASTAMVRILLGWFFAVAVLALVKGGIAANLMVDPSAVLTDGDPRNDSAAVIVSSWYFWAAVGFLAGFNERWAATIIARDPAAPTPPPPAPAAPNP